MPNSSLTIAIFALPSSVFHQLRCSAFLSRKNWSATEIKRGALGNSCGNAFSGSWSFSPLGSISCIVSSANRSA